MLIDKYILLRKTEEKLISFRLSKFLEKSAKSKVMGKCKLLAEQSYMIIFVDAGDESLRELSTTSRADELENLIY